MLRSMTAFSRKERQSEWGTLVWEMRSVNHRYLDVSIRLAEEFRAIEAPVRERLNARINRGKLECSLRYKPTRQIGGAIVINEALAGQLVEAARSVQQLTGETGVVDAMDILRWPGVTGQADTDYTPLHSAALNLLETTLDDYIATREREGQKTAQMLIERCDAIGELVARVRELRPLAAERQRAKLMARIEELNIDHDAARLEQELAFTAQRLDVDEELDRLGAHVSELHDVLKRDEPVGRRLDFLVQEFNREGNTLGSKSSDTAITSITVDLKVLIEQMREQVQNIE